MRAFHLLTLLFIFKYSMENQSKSLFCGALFSLCGRLEVCGIDLVGYIRFEISTYLGVCDNRGWSGGAMVLGKLPVPGRPTILITVGQGPIALAVGAGGGGLDIFTLIYPFSSFSLSLGDGPI